MVVLGALLALAGAGVPARAQPASGRIRFAAASPSVPRAMYGIDRHTNGVTGYVKALQQRADGSAYTLTLTDGATGLEELDAYFYTDLDGTGTPCRVSSSQRGDVETGTIDCHGTPREVWAVIVLTRGADASFTLTY